MRVSHAECVKVGSSDDMIALGDSGPCVVFLYYDDWS